MKIGILGGTFDPPHNGHLAMARAALTTLELDEVIFVPAGKNPLKDRHASAPRTRFEMTKLAIENEPKFLLTDIEIQRKGPSYTIETLSELNFAHPGEYWVILGSDSLKSFQEWKNWEKILKLARLAVAVRKPNSLENLQALLPQEIMEKVDVLEMPLQEVSSTDVRVRIQDGKPYAHLLPDAVRRYIESNRLYRS